MYKRLANSTQMLNIDKTLLWLKYCNNTKILAIVNTWKAMRDTAKRTESGTPQDQPSNDARKRYPESGTPKPVNVCGEVQLTRSRPCFKFQACSTFQNNLDSLTTCRTAQMLLRFS